VFTVILSDNWIIMTQRLHGNESNFQVQIVARLDTHMLIQEKPMSKSTLRIALSPSQIFYTIESLSVSPSIVDDDASELATLFSESSLNVSELPFASDSPGLLANCIDGAV
jgi:hypothetical protein